MVKRLKLQYLIVISLLVIEFPSEHVEINSNFHWTHKGNQYRNVIKVAFFPDLGTMNIINGKPQGLEFSLIEEWSKRNNNKIEWHFVSSSEEAISKVVNGIVDIGAGNIPLQERPGLIYSDPIRSFNWLQYGESDSLLLLKKYPKLSIALNKSDTLPLLIKKTQMWRHADFNKKGWLIPDYLAHELNKKTYYKNSSIFLAKGYFSWVSQSQDSSLIKSVNELIKDPKLNRKINYYKSHNIYSNYQDYQKISPFDDEFKNRVELDKYTLTALVFVESRFRSDIISPAGAIGLMQVIPSTAESLGIDSISLFDSKNNIYAGLKYLRFLDEFWDLKGVQSENRLPFILASYNTGPSRIAKLARKANKLGFSSYLWFDNVDQVAKGPGSHYANKILNIANIYKGYSESITQSKN